MLFISNPPLNALLASLLLTVGTAHAATFSFSGMNGEWVTPSFENGGAPVYSQSAGSPSSIGTGISPTNADFTYKTGSGFFKTTQFAMDNGTPGTAADTLTWGVPASFGGSASGYRFILSDTAMSVTVSPGAPVSFLLGTFTHFNNPIESSSYSLVQTGFSMTASGFSIDGNSMGGAAYAFGVTHTETPNSGTCANGANGSGINVNGCADKVHVDVLTPMAFTFGGVEYTMSVGFDPLGGSGVAAADYWTKENATNTANLYAVFTATPVPEPETYAMLLAGLGLLGFRARAKWLK